MKISVIGNDSNWVGRVDKPRTHIAKGVNDGQEFLVVNFIIYFRRSKFSGIVGDRVEEILFIGLKKYGGKCIVGSIGNESGREFMVELME